MQASSFLLNFVHKVARCEPPHGQDRVEQPPSVEQWGQFKSILDGVDEDKLLAQVMRRFITETKSPMPPYLDVSLHSGYSEVTIDGRIEVTDMEAALMDRLYKEAQD